ncbi:CoA transferase [Pusillimonas sp. TS35]|nr:CoA transferase [Pusillimonas sp. TS35]
MSSSSVTQNDINTGPVLRGTRILDMATFLAAPFAATLCADLGADVVKLELPSGTDPLRSLAPVKGPHSIHAKVTNRGKRGITLDVRKEEGRDLFLRMLPSFDVLVENFRTGTLDSWGLDIKTLHRANPKLIVLRLTGFGQTGPDAKRPGFARIFEAMSGFANLVGEPTGGPQHMNYALGDMIAGLFGAFSITAALAERRVAENMPGREIDLSAVEAMFRLLETLPAEYEELGVTRQRAGACATYTAPSNIYETADGVWVTIVASSDAIFRRLCMAMQREHLLVDPRYQTLGSRVQNLHAIDAEVASWCKDTDLEQVRAALTKHEVPHNRINSIADVFAEPQFKARDAIIRMRDPDFGTLAAPCVVPRFSGCPTPVPESGPNIGQHSIEVYRSLGLSTAEMDRLVAAGVI